MRTIARTLFDSAVEGGIPASTKRKIAEALSAASFAITANVEGLLDDQVNEIDSSQTEEMREAGASLVNLLFDSSSQDNPDQIVRSMSLVTNLERIADSLDQASPALHDVVTPDEPSSTKVLRLSPLNQVRKWRKNFRNLLPKKIRKYF